MCMGIHPPPMLARGGFGEGYRLDYIYFEKALCTHHETPLYLTHVCLFKPVSQLTTFSESTLKQTSIGSNKDD